MTDHDGLYVRVDTVEKRVDTVEERVDKHSAEIRDLQTWTHKMEKILLYAGLFLLGFLFRNPEIIERLATHILNSQ